MNTEIIDVFWSTNYNHKMDCDDIIHIGLPPKDKVPGSLVTSKVYRINTRDESHVPIIKRMYWLMPLKVKEINDMFAMLSHGKTAMELKQFFKLTSPQLTDDSLLCIYYYRPVQSE